MDNNERSPGGGESNDTPIITENDFGMKWHKYLIYFSLWIEALRLVVTGVQYVTGLVYGANGEAGYIYQLFPGLKTIDIVMGLVAILLGVYIIYVRFQLAGYKIGAPKKLSMAYFLTFIILCAYLLAMNAITGGEIEWGEVFDMETIIGLISGVAIMFINKVYYDKRAALFVN